MEKTPKLRMLKSLPWGWLLLILAMGFILRIWGIDNGLPYAQVTDETSDIADSLRIASGQLPTYPYIRTAWNLTQWSVLGPYYVYLRVTDPGFSTAKFEELYFLRRANFILLVRMMTAVLTTLAIIPMFLAGYGLTHSKLGGLLAALLLAVNPPTGYMAHVALSDNLALCGVIIALLGAIWIAQRGTRWAYVIGGVGTAIAMLGHLQTYVVVIAIALAHLVFWWRQPQRPLRILLTRWLWAGSAFVVGHLVMNPFILLAPQAVIADIDTIFRVRMGDAFNLGDQLTVVGLNLINPLLMMRPYLAVAAGIGFIYGIMRRSAEVCVIAAFGLVFSLSLLPTPGPRLTFWLEVAVPTILLVSYGVVQLLRAKSRWSKWIGAVIGLSMVLASCTELILMDVALAQTNTRMQAYDFVTGALAPGTRIMIGEVFTYSVPLARTENSIQRIAQLGKTVAPSYQFQLQNPAKINLPLYDLYGPETSGQFKDEATWWRYIFDENIRYVIQADYCAGGPANFENPNALEFPPLNANLEQRLKLVKVFSPFTTDTCQQIIESRTPMEYMRLGSWVRIGPIIRIYEVPASETF
jgi:hypothetical protein